MTYENTYFHFGPENIDKSIKSDYKAAVTIDAYPDDDNESGHVVAEVFLTKHDDIIIAWHDNGERMNESVIALIKDATTQLKEFRAEPSMHSAEKAIRDMAEYIKSKAFTYTLFGKETELVPANIIDSYLKKHIHDFYNYSKMRQPKICIHNGQTTCCYPIDDCKNCPVINEVSSTTCSFM